MKQLILTIVITLICCLEQRIHAQKNENVEAEKFFSNLKASGYNPDVLPVGNKGPGSPVEVLCTMYVLDISKVDDEKMEFTAEFYFRQSWNDSRLTLRNIDLEKLVFGRTTENIWTPDVFIVQERKGIIHDVFVPNIFIRINKNGEVLLSKRVTVTLACPMDLTKFPHDVQKCKFSFESYGYTRDKILLNWDYRPSDPVGMHDSGALPFEITDLKPTAQDITLTFGTYRNLELNLTFRRKTGVFWTQMYVPYFLLIAVSWATFWISPKFLILRLALLLAILFLMNSICSNLNATFPTYSKAKATDVWMAVCQTLVGAAFLEFIAVTVIAKMNKKDKKSLKGDSEDPELLNSDSKLNETKIDAKSCTIAMIANRLAHAQDGPNAIDKFSRIFFPAAFILFNLIYWLVYCTGR